MRIFFEGEPFQLWFLEHFRLSPLVVCSDNIVRKREQTSLISCLKSVIIPDLLHDQRHLKIRADNWDTLNLIRRELYLQELLKGLHNMQLFVFYLFSSEFNQSNDLRLIKLIKT